MQPHEIEAVREKYRELFEKHIGKRRQWNALIAKRAGWGTGTLREFRNGKYRGNNELIAETLKPILESVANNRSGSRAERSRLATWPYHRHADRTQRGRS